ncbi:MAG TPA: catalase [Cellvibrio sp.]|nr:catalase [Cellvibrio sp.]
MTNIKSYTPAMKNRVAQVLGDSHVLNQHEYEYIPAHIVNTRGVGAYGLFQLYESQSEFTKADFLQNPDVSTSVFVHFSSVADARGVIDSLRGFAVRFYTKEGHFDLVGNNIPVAFAQGKPPVLAPVPHQDTHYELPQTASAQDVFWNGITRSPESTHAIMWAMSDRAIPRSVAMMQGFGGHTFRFTNEQGKSCLAKFHWKPLMGTYSLVWDEAVKLASKDADFHRRQLWELIDRGHYPEWELGVQILAEEDQHKFNFDVLDPTKLIPESLVPVRIIGKLRLNRNPENYCAETDPVAFYSGHLVPGIDVAIADSSEAESAASAGAMVEDHYSQAGLFWRSQSVWEQEHIVSAFCFALAKVSVPAIRVRMLANLTQVDIALAQQVAKGLGMELPAATDSAAHLPDAGLPATDPSLSLVNNSDEFIVGRCVAVLVAEGFESERLLALKESLAIGGASLKIIASHLGDVKSKEGRKFQVDYCLSTVGSVMFDAVFVPGGHLSVEALCKEANAVLFVKEAYKHGKAIGASDEGGMLFTRAARSSILSDRFKGPGVISAPFGSDSVVFVQQFISALARHRFFERSDLAGIVA